MRRASYFLAGIILLQVVVAAEAERRLWLYFPDGDVPGWLVLLGYCYWPAVVGLLYLWCRADAKDRRVAMPPSTFVWVPLLFPVGIPYYYFRTYPARSATFHIGLAGIFTALCATALWLGHALAHEYYATWRNLPRAK